MSTWGTIRLDTIHRIAGAPDGSPAGITPTFDPRLSWRHIPDTRRGDEGRDRAFRTRDQHDAPPRVFGAGERQHETTLIVEVRYLARELLGDLIASDHLDLIAALHATRTYPTGLRVRQVQEPELDEPDDDGRVTARYPIRHIYRVAVTLV